MGRTALIVTSIAAPNAVMRALADRAARHDWDFMVVGDSKSPPDFALPGCRFLSVADQIDLGFAFARACPLAHYARKNVGYLEAMRDGAAVIVETDDDNLPRDEFFAPRRRRRRTPGLDGFGWCNVYGFFSDRLVWPRGLPLDAIHDPLPDFESLAVAERDCPIQQGLADANPDVDAVYRLVMSLPLDFRADRRVALGSGSWCPFNSQNTTWWPDAFPLMYLPALCSFRMSDIWRSFVAQRIAWENGWSVLFHEPTVVQERNAHDLAQDFAAEVPGYLENRRICAALESLPLAAGAARVGDNLRSCYEALAGLGVVPADELALVEAWLADIRGIGPAAAVP